LVVYTTHFGLFITFFSFFSSSIFFFFFFFFFFLVCSALLFSRFSLFLALSSSPTEMLGL
jgi:hypothetical protein